MVSEEVLDLIWVVLLVIAEVLLVLEVILRASFVVVPLTQEVLEQLLFLTKFFII